MNKTDAELIRHLLDQMQSSSDSELQEGAVSRSMDKMRMRAANWLSKKFGKLGLDFRSLAQYQTPLTLKMFQTWMRQYKQTYDTVTWYTVQDFFTRNGQLRNVKFADDLHGRPLSKAEFAEVISDDRQVLIKILGTEQQKLLPRNASELQAKVVQKAPISPGDADTAYAVVVALIEASLVHMFLLSQPESVNQGTHTQAGPGPQPEPTVSTSLASEPSTRSRAPGTDQAAAPDTAVASVTSQEIDTLKKLLNIS